MYMYCNPSVVTIIEFQTMLSS